MTAPSLAAAIREAEEWLTRYDDAVPSIPPGSADPPEVRLLRSLLAALPGETPAPQPTPEPVSPAYTLPPEVAEAAEDVVRGEWWGHYCPSCGSTFKHGPECRIGRLAKALDSARGAKGGE